MGPNTRTENDILFDLSLLMGSLHQPLDAIDNFEKAYQNQAIINAVNDYTEDDIEKLNALADEFFIHFEKFMNTLNKLEGRASAECLLKAVHVIFNVKARREAGEKKANQIDFDPFTGYVISLISFLTLKCRQFFILSDVSNASVANLSIMKEKIDKFKDFATQPSISKLAAQYNILQNEEKNVERPDVTTTASTSTSVSETTALVQFEDIYGMDEIKNELYFLAVLSTTQGTVFDVDKVKSLLLFGPPGWGKTTLIEAFANKTKRRFFKITAGDLLQSLYGASEKYLTSIFEQAAQAPSILFIDEIDTIFKRRTESKDVLRQSLQGMLLAKLDGGSESAKYKNIIFFAATNFIDELDVALLDRFNAIYVGPPKTEHEVAGYKSMVKDYLRKSVSKIMNPDEINFDNCVELFTKDLKPHEFPNPRFIKAVWESGVRKMLRQTVDASLFDATLGYPLKRSLEADPIMGTVLVPAPPERVANEKTIILDSCEGVASIVRGNTYKFSDKQTKELCFSELGYRRLTNDEFINLLSEGYKENKRAEKT